MPACDTHAAVPLFASFLFLAQSIGVMLAASLIDRMGASAVVALEGVFGLGFEATECRLKIARQQACHAL